MRQSIFVQLVWDNPCECAKAFRVVSVLSGLQLIYMSAPTEIQFKQLKRLLENLRMAIPVHCRRLENGSVQVNVGNPYVIRDGSQMDAFLNDLMDINTDVEPDELYDAFVALLDPHSDY